MKTLIFILIWVLSWFWYYFLEMKNYMLERNKNIVELREEISKIQNETETENLKAIKKKYLENEKKDIYEKYHLYEHLIKDSKNKKSEWWIEIVDFWKLYAEMYKVMEEDEKENIWFEEFKNSEIFKYFEELKKNTVLSIIKKNDKIIEVKNFIPVDIDCDKYRLDYCPVIVDNIISNIEDFSENNLILKKDFVITISKEEIRNFIKNKENFTKFINKN